MARVLVTGSADGLGRALAARLVADGHAVILHARDEARVREARDAVPGAAGGLAGDLADLLEVRGLAAAADAGGRFDAVVHNAGVGYRERRELTADGIEHVFAVNVLAPYVLSALMEPPDRVITLGSGMARAGGHAALEDLAWERRRWNGAQAYGESKGFDVTLARALAARWPQVHVSAVDPGWVATRMGGAGAPGTLEEGTDTQAWLLDGAGDGVPSGTYLRERRARALPPGVGDADVQAALLQVCAAAADITLPEIAHRDEEPRKTTLS